MVKHEIVTLTPEMAQRLLESSPGNRQLRRRQVESYARQMREGKWKLNGQPIVLDDRDRLMQGHHRCHAVLQSGCSIETLLVRGIASEARETQDQMIAWSCVDVLVDRGEHHAKHLAPVLQLVDIWVRSRDGVSLERAKWMSRPPAELIGLLDGPDGNRIRAGAELSSRLRIAAGMLTSSVLGFLWWALSQVDEEEAREFLEAIETGANLPPQSPILALRRRLVPSQSGRRIPRFERLALAIKAWNAWRAKTGRRVVRIRRAGPRREGFPEIAGFEEESR